MANAIVRVVDNRAVVQMFGASQIKELIVAANDRLDDVDEAIEDVNAAIAAFDGNLQTALDAVATVDATLAEVADIRDAVVAALDTGELAGVFQTYADADAATLANGDFIIVRADETRRGHRVMYWVVAGVLDFVSDLSLGEYFYPETFGAVGNTTVTPNGVWTIGADDSDAVEACFAACSAAGGGVVWLSAFFNMTRNFTVPNNNDPNGVDPNTDGGVPTQNSIKIAGPAAFSAGQQDGQAPSGGFGLVWTGGGTSLAQPARINTHGRGLLQFESVTLAAVVATDTVGRPFIFTSNTTTWVDGIAFWTAHVREQCANDPWVGGGRTTVFGQRATSPFQGYGSRVRGCYMNGVRTLRAQTYCNSVIFDSNNFWSNCGSNEVNGSAINVNGNATDAPNQYATGTIITNNLIETPGYDRPISLDYASAATIIGNSVYDEDAVGTGIAECAIYLGENVNDINVFGRGVAPIDKPFITGPGAVIGRLCYISAYSVEQSIIASLQAGLPDYPNAFGPTNFTSSENVIQPTEASAAGALPYLRLKRPPGAAVSPGADVIVWRADGSISFGDANSINSGEVYAAAPGQPQFLLQGRQWGFAGRAGFPMEIHTGSGANTLTNTTAALMLQKADGSPTEIRNGGTRILAGQRTGWSPASGTKSRATFNPATATTEEVAQRLAAFIDDMFVHGLIGF